MTANVPNSHTRTESTYGVHSRPSGPHWVAWAADSNGKPLRSVLLVGQTQQEAEARAREWIAGQETPER